MTEAFKGVTLTITGLWLVELNFVISFTDDYKVIPADINKLLFLDNIVVLQS